MVSWGNLWNQVSDISFLWYSSKYKTPLICFCELSYLFSFLCRERLSSSYRSLWGTLMSIISHLAEASLANLSASSFPCMPLWAGTTNILIFRFAVFASDSFVLISRIR